MDAAAPLLAHHVVPRTVPVHASLALPRGFIVSGRRALGGLAAVVLTGAPSGLADAGVPAVRTADLFVVAFHIVLVVRV